MFLLISLTSALPPERKRRPHWFAAADRNDKYAVPLYQTRYLWLFRIPALCEILPYIYKFMFLGG